MVEAADVLSEQNFTNFAAMLAHLLKTLCAQFSYDIGKETIIFLYILLADFSGVRPL